MKKALLLLGVLCLAGGFWWWEDARRGNPDGDMLTLYGNVDIRQVESGFRVGGRIVELSVEEGQAVKAGDRWRDLIRNHTRMRGDRAQAELAMQRAEYAKMLAGAIALKTSRRHGPRWKALAASMPMPPPICAASKN